MSGRAPIASVVVEREVHAGIDTVFAALTSADAMARWFSPTGVAAVDADVSVGGSFHIVMLGEGVRIEHTGKFLAVDPPHRISFTWESPYTGSTPGVVTITLTPRGELTVVRLTHEGLPDAAAVESHRSGWPAILGQLAQLVERQRQ